MPAQGMGPGTGTCCYGTEGGLTSFCLEKRAQGLLNEGHFLSGPWAVLQRKGSRLLSFQSVLQNQGHDTQVS